MPASALQKSRAPLFAGIGIAVALVLGAAGYLVNKSLTAAEEAKQAADELVRTRSRPPVQQAPAQAEPEPVFVVVVSDPLEAQVRASWKGGEKEGTAPLSIEAPRNAKIHLEISRSGFLPYQADLVADVAQTFTAKLTALAMASPAPPAERDREPAHTARKTASQKKKKKELSKDSLMDIGDALK